MAKGDVCPQVNSPEWKKLVSELGEISAYSAFNKNGGEIPTVDKARELLNLSKESKILKDIRDRLTKVKAIYEKRKLKDKAKEIVNRLDGLNQALDVMDEMEGILEYITETSDIVSSFEKNMQAIKDNPDSEEAIDRLVSINGFISVFDNLKEIHRASIVDGKEEDTILSKTILRIDRLHNEYLEIGIPLIAKKLFKLIDKDTLTRNKELKGKLLTKNGKDSKALSIITSEEDLIEQMKLASRDITGYERWLCSSLGGTNPIISLTSMLVKNTGKELYDDLSKDEEELGEAYEKFKEGRPIDNPKELNSKFIEVRSDGYKHFISKGSLQYRSLSAEERAYYDVILDKFYEYKSLLPTKYQEAIGDRVPSVMKTDFELAREGRVKKILKDKIDITDKDTNYGLTETDGGIHKDIPVFYTRKMDADEVSDDLLRSILIAGKNWREYDYKSKIHSEVQLIRDITQNLKVTKTNSKGEAMIDRVSYGKDKVITKEGVTNIQKRLEETLDNIYYGQEDEKTLFNVNGKDVSADKITQTLLTATSAISLTGNWIAGISNSVMGNIQNLTERVAGEFMSKGSFKTAYGEYASNIHNFIADRGKLTGKHWMTRIGEEYEFIQGDFVDNFGNNISGSRLRKEFSTNNLFFINNGGEHQIQYSAGLAMMASVKMIGGSFVSSADYKGDRKEFDKAKSLLDYYKEGKGVLPSEVKELWTKDDRQKLRNRIHEVNKYLHGNYAKFDRTTLQRTWYGKLAIMYRKYIVPGVARRFGDERVNLGTGTVMEGSYLTVLKFFKDTAIAMKNEGWKEALGVYKNLTPLQRANIRRVNVEAFSLFVMMAIVAGLKDDDDKNYAQNLLLLEARRLQSELSFYTPSLEPLRILKSPTVTMGTVEAMAKFSHGVLFVYGEDDKYKRDTGMWEKGDDKDLARLTKLIPGLKAVLSGLSPEEQYKTFNKLL